MPTTSHINPRKEIPKGSRVVVAMSGGVDSSVAAGYLKHQGYDVIGISLQLHDMASQVENTYGTCCSLTDIGDARRVAEVLQIPFYVANMETEFHQGVIDNFVSEYLAGRTPNPCVKCNEKVKFRKLMDWALDLGADYLATGHYARVGQNLTTGHFDLLKGDSSEKDQSYFLFTLKQEDLARTLFPVGGMEKTYVRQLAVEYGLAVAKKPDSQEICFVQAKSYKDFVAEHAPQGSLRPGKIVDLAGNVLGEHSGLHAYTVGQRKGLGVHSTDPLFVLELRPETNELVVGANEGLLKRGAAASAFHWVTGKPPAERFRAEAKIRYRSKESPVDVEVLPSGEVRVSFEVAQRAVTPGQALVLYDGARVLGGGWIDGCLN